MDLNQYRSRRLMLFKSIAIGGAGAAPLERMKQVTNTALLPVCVYDILFWGGGGCYQENVLFLSAAHRALLENMEKSHKTKLSLIFQ